MHITLCPVTHRNLRELTSLDVRDDQRTFVASNTWSLLEAYAALREGKTALPFGIYDGDLAVGFVMIGYDTLDWEEEPSAARNSYCLWRFMIDARYQGRGYGKAALAAVLDYIKTFPCGAAQTCWTSWEPDNTAAAALYTRFGFRENGERDGTEIVAILELSFGGAL